ncbi:chitin synthase-domain-containing protein [Cladochytrium replicatum]|nr:chitin synthase-domain-containing protein [Cladochytrium replicatum]
MISSAPGLPDLHALQRGQIQPRPVESLRQTRFRQTGAINVPVSEHCLEDAQYVHGEEFITMRYTPVTVGPNDFSSKYTLRSHRLRERDPKVAVVLTMYNEPDDLFCKSFIALAKNIAWCCSPDSKYNWGPDGWKDVVIVIVGDGREKINQRVLTALGVQGVYVEGLMKTTHDGKDVTMHMFEYTTQVFVDRDLTVRTAKDGLPPVQVIFMLKEKNAKKINSHRWFFNGVCKQLQPEVCMLVDVGTRPSKSSILELYRAFDRNPRIGGACGEIKVDLGYGWRHLLNPLVAAQNFEYKMSNILDKSFESVFGYISVLPGAFSAYRYIAIQNTPLDRYFKGESLHSGVVDITTSNMYLAEDRILCFELISKYKEAWLLKYVKSARADTDTPASLPELISQRRRWLNGSVFATFHAITWWTQIFRSNHSPARKALLVVQMIYNLINLIFSWFNIANFFLSFYFLFEVSGQLGDASSPFGSAQTVVGQLLIQLYVFVLITQFVASLGNRPQGSVILYYSTSGILAVIMAFMIFLGGWAIAQSFKSYQAFLDVSPGTNAGLGFFIFFFTDPTFRDVLVSLLATYGLYIISSLLHWDAWHCLTSMIQYLLLLPTYINVFQVFAFCNIHDISWGTKGDNLPSAAVAGAKQKQSQPATIGGPIVMKDSPGSSSDGPRMSLLDKDDLEALWHKHYHQLEFNRANPADEEDKPVVDEKTRNEDYFKLYRTRLVLTWLVTNFSIMIVFTSQTIRDAIGASSTKAGPDGKLIPRVNPYLTFLFWSVVVLSACRFIGSMVYITTWWMEESADDKAWKWEQQRSQRDLEREGLSPA